MVSFKRPNSGRCLGGCARYSVVERVGLAGCLIVTAYDLARRTMQINVTVIGPDKT